VVNEEGVPSVGFDEERLGTPAVKLVAARHRGPDGGVGVDLVASRAFSVRFQVQIIGAIRATTIFAYLDIPGGSRTEPNWAGKMEERMYTCIPVSQHLVSSRLLYRAPFRMSFGRSH
jgi:hypothetical protein